MMRSLVLVLCLGTVALGDTPTTSPAFKSDAGKEAMRRYAVAYVSARAAFFRTIIDADQRKIADLDRAMKIAMAASDLDEANQIKTAQDAAADALKEDKIALTQQTTAQIASSAGPAQPFVIFARDRWTPTLQVHKGERYRITAVGRWSGGPDANKNRVVCGPQGMVVPDGDHKGDTCWYLEGRINQGYPFVIGAGTEFVADQDGMLQMQMMDWWIYDDDGSVETKIEHLSIAGP